MNLHTTKSQTIALMSAELSAIQKQCEQYQAAVNNLSRQVGLLADRLNQADQRFIVREKQLTQQLNELQSVLGQLL